MSTISNCIPIYLQESSKGQFLLSCIKFQMNSLKSLALMDEKQTFALSHFLNLWHEWDQYVSTFVTLFFSGLPFECWAIIYEQIFHCIPVFTIDLRFKGQNCTKSK